MVARVFDEAHIPGIQELSSEFIVKKIVYVCLQEATTQSLRVFKAGTTPCLYDTKG